jgi:hypothetical protein
MAFLKPVLQKRNIAAVFLSVLGAFALSRGMMIKYPGPWDLLPPAVLIVAPLLLATVHRLEEKYALGIPTESLWMLFAPFGLMALAFVPFDFPQHWNHFAGKLRASATLAGASWVYAFVFFFARWFDRNHFPQRHEVRLALICFLLALGTLGFLAGGKNWGPDEPLYIMNTQSLVKDRDLNVANNADVRWIDIWQRNQWLSHDLSEESNLYLYAKTFFQGGTYYKQGSEYHIYSGGAPGLPLLLAPGYFIGGETGMVLCLSLIAALTLALIYQCLRSRGSAPGPSFRTVAAVGFLSPFALYSFHFYPEIPAAFILALLFRYLFAGPAWREWLLGISCGFLIWLSPRFIILFLAMIALRSRANKGHGLAGFWLGALMVTGALAILNLKVHGHVLSIGRGFESGSGESGAGNILAMIHALGPLGVGAKFLGQFLDANYGLIPFFPVTVLFMAALWLGKKGGVLKSGAAFVCAVYWGALSLYTGYGGPCYPARYLVAALPLLALCGEEWQRAARPWFVRMLVAVGIAWMLVSVTYPKMVYYHTVLDRLGFPFPLLRVEPLGLSGIPLLVFWLAVLGFGLRRSRMALLRSGPSSLGA